MYKKKKNIFFLDAPKTSPTFSPWGDTSTTNNNTNVWEPFSNQSSSSFGNTNEWPQQTNVSNENLPTGEQMRIIKEKIFHKKEHAFFL